MKTIGLIGGMSWESTALYYQIINEQVKQRLGGLHSAKLIMVSVDFADIERLQQAGEWQQAGKYLAGAARSLEAAGADFIVLCTNTMHIIAEAITQAVALPMLHIADATAQAIKTAGVQRVGLLGTRFTMEQPFYRDRLQTTHQIEVLTPNAKSRQSVHDIIFQELCLGVINADSRQAYREIIADLVAQGAQAIVMGCTEIPLLIDGRDSAVPLFDTTAIHAIAAVEQALTNQASI